MPEPTRCPRCGRARPTPEAPCPACEAPPILARRAPAPAPPGPPPLPGGSSLRVAVVPGDGAPAASFAVEGELVCGRAEGALRLSADPTVSPRHARFVRAGEALAVEDLGSLNGTFVRLRSPRRLAPGEEVRVGRQLLRLERLACPPASPGAGAEAALAGAAGVRLRLVQLLEDGGEGDAFVLPEGESVVGREAGAVTFPADRAVSARHARLVVRDGAATVQDLGSSNGTFVRIAGRAELAPGDQVLVGRQLLRIDR